LPQLLLKIWDKKKRATSFYCLLTVQPNPMHKFYEPAHKNALTLSSPRVSHSICAFGKLSRGTFVVVVVAVIGKGKEGKCDGQQLTMFTVTTVCRCCLMPKLMTIILSATWQGCAFYDEAPLQQQQQQPNNHRLLLLLLLSPHTAATLFMG